MEKKFERNKLVKLSGSDDLIMYTTRMFNDSERDYLTISDLKKTVFNKVDIFYTDLTSKDRHRMAINFQAVYNQDIEDPKVGIIATASNMKETGSVTMPFQDFVDAIAMSIYDDMELNSVGLIKDMIESATKDLMKNLFKAHTFIFDLNLGYSAFAFDRKGNKIAYINDLLVDVDANTLVLKECVSHYDLRELEIDTIKIYTGTKVIEISDIDITCAIPYVEFDIKDYTIVLNKAEIEIKDTDEDKANETITINANEVERLIGELTSKEELIQSEAEEELTSEFNGLFDF